MIDLSFIILIDEGMLKTNSDKRDPLFFIVLVYLTCEILLHLHSTKRVHLISRKLLLFAEAKREIY